MGKFNITSEQEEELKGSDSTTPVPLKGAAGQGKGTYHNPVTGREIISLMDPYHIMKRLRQGWQLGPASPELKEKWAIREAELREEDDRMEAEYVASNEHRDAEKSRFNEAVTTAVAAVLEKLEVALPGKSGAESTAPAPAPEGEPEETQLPLWGSDATPETDTKLTVSEASRPDLRLVDTRKD
ncbi:hypothetical protein LCGC14_1274000 [marine sediment metagenome]|uniref:Uncharacterized protein n=1 Tax=marine sediment metagenome TaxID=412755 RepID=A0A0F9KX96_9ZZZZ